MANDYTTVGHERAQELLTKAAGIVTSEKARDYGDPVVMWTHVARVWSAYLGIEVTPTDALHLMQQLKQVRQKLNSAPDNLIDNAGYAGLTAAFVEYGTPEEYKMLDRSKCAVCNMPIRASQPGTVKGGHWVHANTDHCNA